MRKVNVCSLGVFLILCNFIDSQVVFLPFTFGRTSVIFVLIPLLFASGCNFTLISLYKNFLFVLIFFVELSCSFSLLEKDKIRLFRKEYPTIGNALLEQRIELTELVRRRV